VTRLTFLVIQTLIQHLYPNLKSTTTKQNCYYCF